VAAALCSLLTAKTDMLREYFQIGFTTDLDTLYLVSMPELLTGYRPQPETLPLFLLRLGVEVDWEEEYGCFDSVSKELALCYCALPSGSADIQPPVFKSSGEGFKSSGDVEREETSAASAGGRVDVEANILSDEASRSGDEGVKEGSDVGEGESGDVGVGVGDAEKSTGDAKQVAASVSSHGRLSPAARTVLLEVLLPALKTYVSPPQVSRQRVERGGDECVSFHFLAMVNRVISR
jgi:hypothetical protein